MSDTNEKSSPQPENPPPTPLSRRRFLQASGIGALALGASYQSKIGVNPLVQGGGGNSGGGGGVIRRWQWRKISPPLAVFTRPIPKRGRNPGSGVQQNGPGNLSSVCR